MAALPAMADKGVDGSQSRYFRPRLFPITVSGITFTFINLGPLYDKVRT